MAILRGMLMLLFLTPAMLAAESPGQLFGWQFPDADQDLSPRGGTTRGAMPEMREQPTQAWQALQAADLTDRERDRRAILAMAGEYRVSFEFLETEGYSADFQPARPYRSWATEVIEVLADKPDFISLQHVLVMHFEQENGEGPEGPMVTRHWRQDWYYEGCTPFRYLGADRWQTGACEEAGSGGWVQAVYHVDDSPRYATHGHWEHAPGRSSWLGADSWRPLPQREFTVRDDYDVLVASNRQTITPQGWVHEQRNLKGVLAEPGRLDPDQPFLAQEIGVNRYEPVASYDFGPGYDYLEATADFWQDVREAWAELLAASEEFELISETGQGQLFMRLFQLAGAEHESAAERREAIDALLDEHVRVHRKD